MDERGGVRWLTAADHSPKRAATLHSRETADPFSHLGEHTFPLCHLCEPHIHRVVERGRGRIELSGFRGSSQVGRTGVDACGEKREPDGGRKVAEVRNHFCEFLELRCCESLGEGFRRPRWSAQGAPDGAPQDLDSVPHPSEPPLHRRFPVHGGVPAYRLVRVENEADLGAPILEVKEGFDEM